MRLSISTRIFLGFAAVLTVFGLVSTFAVWRMHRIGQEIRLVSDGYLPLTKVAAQLETFHKNRQRDTDRLLDEADPRTQRILIKLARLYFPRIVREKLGQGRSLVEAARGLGGGDEKAFLDGIDARLREIATSYDEYDALAEALFAQIEAGETVASPRAAPAPVPAPTTGPEAAAPAPARASERGKELKRIERRIDRELRLLGHDLDVRVRERVWEAQRLERSSSWGIIGFALGAILLGLAATLMSQRLLAPVRTLTEAAVRIGRGDYAAEVPTDAGNEVGVLAREFNHMAASLAARERELGEKQAALVRAERLAAIGSVAAQITHEIRNPLSSIGLNAELLAEEIPDDERGGEARRLLGSIAREVDRLAEITEEYLRFARLPAPELAPEDVSALLADLVAFVRPELEAAGIEVQLDAPEGLWALVDEGQFRQALLNLVRNSREAMNGAGTLTLSARRDGDRVAIAVADTGPGIDRAEQARIFDPFFTTKKRGTGLGLTLTQQIVAAHRGSIDLASAPGAGTTFTVRLPGVQTT
jgi:two-component system NtrC family sensor kinase